MGWIDNLVGKLDKIRGLEKDDSIISASTFNFKYDLQLKMEFEYNDMVINCNTKIDDVSGDELAVLAPTYDGKPCKLESGHNVTVSLLDSTGIYTFDSQVVGDFSHENSLKIKKPEKMKRFEQRRSVRVWVSMPVLCYLEEINIEGLPNEAEVWSKDISMNGLCFVVEWPLPVDSIMKINFTLPKGAGKVQADIRIVRCVQDVLPDKYVIGAEFSALSLENKKSIKQFVDMRLKKL